LLLFKSITCLSGVVVVVGRCSMYRAAKLIALQSTTADAAAAAAAAAGPGPLHSGLLPVPGRRPGVSLLRLLLCTAGGGAAAQDPPQLRSAGVPHLLKGWR
jgi:hypothetical protein